MRNKVPALTLAAVLLSVPVGGCRSASSSNSPDDGDASRAGGIRKHHPVLLMGLDGIEWSVVLEMIRDDKLPVIAGLMQRGAYGKMATTIPTLSPIIWTSIATGMTAKKHGIRGFIHVNEQSVDGIRRLYTGNDRKTKAFWNILSDLGLRVNTIGWWMTYPAEQCNGIMVSQVNHSTVQANQKGDGAWKGGVVTDKPLEGQVWPPERQSEILSIAQHVEESLPAYKRNIFGELETRLGPVTRRLWDASRWALRADAIYRRVGLDLLASDDAFDLFAIYFGGTDIIAHRFWRYTYPDEFRIKPTDEDIRLLGDMIRKYYAHIDSVVGEFIAAAPSDSIVILVSDHGMKAGNVDGTFDLSLDIRDLNSGRHPYAPPAFFVSAGPNIRTLAPDRPPRDLTDADLPQIGRIFDVLPTILALMQLPVARDMDGTVLREIIDPRFLEEHPVQLVDTYTGADWHAKRTQSAPERSDVVDRLEQLRALGYFQDQTEAAPNPSAPSEE